MIKSVVGFINGTIYKNNQTNRTIYLSDGTQWNHHTFSQAVSLTRAYMLREVSLDEGVQYLQREIEGKKTALKAKLIAINMVVTDPFTVISRSQESIRFGKHIGKRLCDIAIEDTKYLKWLTSQPFFDIDRTLRAPKS